jgi:predicted nicotinamide N-methyase
MNFLDKQLLRYPLNSTRFSLSFHRPKEVYITDIHHTTLVNAAHNVRINCAAGDGFTPSDATTTERTTTESESETKTAEAAAAAPTPLTPSTVTYGNATYKHSKNTSTLVSCLNVNWQDGSTFPPEPLDVLLGSDLVYDSAILGLLVPAVKKMLKPDGSFLYCAPDEGRDGMSDLLVALESVGIVCVENTPVPDFMYSNPLCGE